MQTYECPRCGHKVRCLPATEVRHRCPKTKQGQERWPLLKPVLADAGAHVARV